MSDAALQGRVAVVTGGGSGIGRAIARRFARAGARVVVAGRREAAIAAVAAETHGIAVTCDVTRLDDVEALFARALAWGGSCDVFVNNAGQTGPVGALAEVDLDAWRACIEVNLFGAMHGLRVAARIMAAQGRGSIINMSSRMGLHGYPMRSAYSATKFALIGMTEAVAREVGPRGVRVNALCPGAVSGELMERVIAARAAAEGRPPEEIIRRDYTDSAALRRWLSPEEVADAALFLASDASSAVTGERIRVDCGRF
ncbi:SDR family NAD(P)-dependent oxidoreductase [Falsiroseomonas sp. HW251]|uniref:SDR family NAD(P)-dependent oxidoreductase n=1 Tax=Falsiroseomonas sp. HW251 TaxID=3390998 RepID=UPI003D31A97F